jgi:hypothetical protein
MMGMLETLLNRLSSANGRLVNLRSRPSVRDLVLWSSEALDLHVPTPHLDLWIPSELELPDKREQRAFYSGVSLRQSL